ncbi:MAG: hypothetical protein JWO19_1382 [Bryobacterales bacterium]|nr:hypothetical protein [Bryobacterales bacterium]
MIGATPGFEVPTTVRPFELRLSAPRQLAHDNHLDIMLLRQSFEYFYHTGSEEKMVGVSP